jgi:hydroxyquinol 1,2-dioxygenase
VDESLITKVNKNDPDSPFPKLPSIRFDFRLSAAAARAASGRVGADPSKVTGH